MYPGFELDKPEQLKKARTLKFSLREVKPSDFRGLADLLLEVSRLNHQEITHLLQESAWLLKTRDLISGIASDKNAALLIAESENKLIGFIHLRLQKAEQETYVEISNMAVSRKFRYQEVEQALMERAKIWSSKKGSRVVQLNPNDFNRAAQNFFTKLVKKRTPFM